MTLRSSLGDLRRQVMCSMHSRQIALSNQGPIVSFCFDDFPRSAYLAGGAILKSFGVLGTYYVALGLMNTSNNSGDQFISEDLGSLLADGHELGCHTFSHVSCRDVPLNVFERDVQKGREAIRRMTGCDAVNFAYPFGRVTLAAKKQIGRQMTSCRGIYSGINGPRADLNLLRANSLYGDVDRSAEVEALLSENRHREGWLIFYTHDVRENSSPFGCTPALLDKSISLALEKGFRIVPVGKAIAAT